MMIRFLFYGGTREKNQDGSVRRIGQAHNGAFYFAAKNVSNDYRDGDKRLLRLTDAADMVRKINFHEKSSLASLDVFCHGTPYSLNFSLKENENCGLVTGWMAKQAISLYYSSQDGEKYSFSSDSRYVSDIDFSVFTQDARIQIHGCNTAKGWMPGNTLVEALSEQLSKASKTKAYVIGHTDKSNPNINGTKTTIMQQDYRHGERSIYYNGELLKKTIQNGLLSHKSIQELIGS